MRTENQNLNQSAKEPAKAEETLIISNLPLEESYFLKENSSEVLAMSNVTYIENPKDITDLLNILETYGDRFRRVIIDTHGDPGNPISTMHLTQDERDLNVEISEVIDILNEKNNAKEIHIFSCHAGDHFGEKEALEKLQKVTKPGQVIVLHSDEKTSLSDLDDLRTKSAIKNNLSPIANAILTSPEAINVFVRLQTGYSTFSSEIFSRNPETEISTANLGKYIKEQVARAQKFEAENGIKSDPEIDNRLANLTTEENLQKYLSRLLALSMSKISTFKEWSEFSSQWNREVMKMVDINLGGIHILSLMAEKGSAEGVNFILESGKANVDAVDEYNDCTALYFAAQKGHVGVAENLLKHGANPNIAKGVFGTTPYHIAAQNGHTEVLKVFYKHGVAYPNIKDADGITAIFIALDNKHDETFRYIFETNNDRDPNITFDGNTVLNLAANKAAKDKDYIRFVELLLKAGDNPNIPDKNGWTVLMNLVLTGDVKIVKLAMDHGADLWAENSDGLAAREIAELYKKSEVVAFLQNQEKLQLDLAGAVHSKNFTGVKDLIKLGANPNLPQFGDLEERVWTPLDRAVDDNNVEMVKLLLEKGARPKDQEAFDRIFERAGGDVANEVLQVVLGAGQMLGFVKADSKSVVVEMTHPTNPPSTRDEYQYFPTSSAAQCFDNPPPIPSFWQSYSSDAEKNAGINTYSSKDLTEESRIPPQDVKPKDVTQVSEKGAKKTGGKSTEI